MSEPLVTSKVRKRRATVNRRRIAATATSPAEVRAFGDPGDETERNYRYQHSYGAILIIAAKRGEKPYTSLFCEHHEDLLAERSDGRFDGYQIKTSRPEQGAWTMRDGEVVGSVGKFVDLVTEFGDKIADLYFVSNKEFLEVSADIKDQGRKAVSPKAFLEYIRSCADPPSVGPPFNRTLDELAASCGCSSDTLFPVLKRVDLILGPSRDSFDAVIAHEHLASLPECSNMNRDQLNKILNSIVAQVWMASSRKVLDPIRHLRPLIDSHGLLDPVIASKRIDIEKISCGLSNADVTPFQFPGHSTLLTDSSDLAPGREKLSRGDIDEEQIELMEKRGRAAEFNLIADVHRRPQRYPALLQQLESVVRGECQEAFLRAYRLDQKFGVAMLIDVQDRLRRVSAERREMIGCHEYECLVGIAHMLTCSCRIWWSNRFSVGDAGPKDQV